MVRVVAQVKSSPFYFNSHEYYRDENVFYNWATHISIKETGLTVKRKLIIIIYISLLRKID